MASNVFDLRDGGDDTEDYLSFGFPGGAGGGGGDDSPPATRSSSSAKPKAKKRGVSAATMRQAELMGDDDDFDLPPGLTGIPAPRSALTGQKRIPLKQVQEHQLLCMQLNSYAASIRFKPVIESNGIHLKDLNTKSVADLKELRERVRACCANSGGGAGMFASGGLKVCGVIEAAVPKKLCDLTGFRSTLENDPEYHTLAEMIELDSGFKATMSPMMRMVMCVGGAAANTAVLNRGKAAVKTQQQDLVASLTAQRDRAQQAAPIAPSVAPNQVPVPTTGNTPQRPLSMYDD